MSFDKAIEHGKEHRKPYKGSKAIDPTCRNHRGCPWCEENRLYQSKKAKLIANEKMKDFNSEDGNYGEN